MSLYIASINSGSNGNCYYVGNESEAVLVDVGISCREIEKRMNRLGLSMQKIKGVFVSHEHADHIKGICSIVKKYKVPVYITSVTLAACGFAIEEHLIKYFKVSEPVTIGNLSITAFSKFHDACDPCSFIISCKDINVGVFTDLGVPCKNLVKHFKQCHAAFLEANYDEVMLNEGNYPYFLKKRIKGGNGHLSNQQALNLFTAHKPAYMSYLLLSHLSHNNNCPNLVQQLFEEHANGVKMIVATRFRETEVYKICNQTDYHKKKHYAVTAGQLSFTFT